VVALAAPAEAALTGGARLAAIYDHILQARFEVVEAGLSDACPPAPDEACKALRVVSSWWQILLDPESRERDRRFTEQANAAIVAAEAWTRREPRRAEAWFYLAGSYAPLVNWRVLREERLAAARDGKGIKDALERALELDPTLYDAFFGIGLYHYLADVAPPAVKLLRWLLLLPGGDRVKGLKEILQARDNGELLRGEADYQLHLMYLWYERKPTEALALLERLDERYGSNPLFLQRIALLQTDYLHDHPASAAVWETLLERARAGRVSAAQGAEVSARLGLAAELDAMFETDRAIDQLEAVINLNPTVPFGSRARAELQLGAAYDRLGHRDLALRAYAAAVSFAPAGDRQRLREHARVAIRTKPDARAADGYRLSLEAWRAFQRGAVDQAALAIGGALALAPDDPLTLYRHARVLEARGDDPAARQQLERVLAARPIASAVVLAPACVELAQLLERAGDRARAIEMYRVAAEIAGGDPHARDQAARALKRLGATNHARPTFFDKFCILCLTLLFSRP
jgi:tetratricopeptide (TPR) repeat protein